MTDLASRALLPTGLRDILPPDAEHEARVVHAMMDFFAGHGYERVKPPLIEFEDSLFAGSGAATAGQTFRVMDPEAHRMMGLRPDMTTQVARIAETRLANAPRPLRLSYAGQVLRVKGSQLRPERQFGQAGVELIGSDAPAADLEVILLAARALGRLGLPGVSIDLSLPRLVPAICAVHGVDPTRAPLRDALDHKDAAMIAAHGGSAAPLLGALLHAAGPAKRSLEELARLDLPPAAAEERQRLATVAALLAQAAPGLTLTVDPVENRGFEYYTGICFTLFSRASSAELGRGGRYRSGEREPGIGVTLFLDSVLAALPRQPLRRRVYLPAGTDVAQGETLRADGWATVAGLEEVADARAEAARLGCGHVVIGGAVSAVAEGEF